MIYEYILEDHKPCLKTYMPTPKMLDLSPAKIFMHPTALIATNRHLRHEFHDFFVNRPPPSPQVLRATGISATVRDMRFGNVTLYAQFARHKQSKKECSTPLQLDIKLVFRHINTTECSARLYKWLDCCDRMTMCATYTVDTEASCAANLEFLWWYTSPEWLVRGSEASKVYRALKPWVAAAPCILQYLSLGEIDGFHFAIAMTRENLLRNGKLAAVCTREGLHMLQDLLAHIEASRRPLAQ